jgi:uncharacterized repeat protein (TIGR02543 family)
MFNQTFYYYAMLSTGTAPHDLFAGVVVPASAAGKTGNMFNQTFPGYAFRRFADFSVGGSVVSGLRQLSIASYSVNVNGVLDTTNNPTINVGDVIEPTFWVPAGSQTMIYDPADPNSANNSPYVDDGFGNGVPVSPYDPAYAGYNWYTTDGTSCLVASPTPDCGSQTAATLHAFPDSTTWTTADVTENGNMIFYANASLSVTPSTTYTVTFDTGSGGSVVPSVVVANGSVVDKPSPDPTLSGFVFSGWYSDPGLTTPWDFVNDVVSGDMTLYAKWIVIPEPPVTPPIKPVEPVVPSPPNTSFRL